MIEIFIGLMIQRCGAGKTTFTKYLVTKHKAIISGGKSADMEQIVVDMKIGRDLKIGREENNSSIIIVDYYNKEKHYTRINNCEVNKDIRFGLCELYRN